MNKYINLGVGFGLIIATTSVFGFSLSAEISLNFYYCNGTSFDNCKVEKPNEFVPGTPFLSPTVMTALQKRYPNNTIAPMVAGLMTSGEGSTTLATLWFTSNAPNPATSSHQVVVKMTDYNTFTLTGTNGNPAFIGLKAYYIPCGTNPPAEGSPALNVSGSTQTTSVGISLYNTSTDQNLDCPKGGNIYFALAPQGLVNGFLPGDTYGNTLTLTTTST